VRLGALASAFATPTAGCNGYPEESMGLSAIYASAPNVQGSVALRLRKLFPVLPVPLLYLVYELGKRGPALYPYPFGTMRQMCSCSPVERVLVVLVYMAGQPVKVVVA
jgi:hypothetical protein